MILCTAAGWCLQRFAGLPSGLSVGLLSGLLVAPLVPAKSSCKLPRSERASGWRPAGEE